MMHALWYDLAFVVTQGKSYQVSKNEYVSNLEV